MTQKLLHQLLSYNPKTGIFVWKIRSANCIHVGDVAGFESFGYTRICIQGKKYRAHQLAWLYVYGVIPKMLDHKNGRRDDNRIENLRLANMSQNTANRKTLRNGLKGVSFFKRDGNWMAQICKDGKRIYLGSFPTEQEAHAVYVSAANKHHGEFSRAA